MVVFGILGLTGESRVAYPAMAIIAATLMRALALAALLSGTVLVTLRPRYLRYGWLWIKMVTTLVGTVLIWSPSRRDSLTRQRASPPVAAPLHPSTSRCRHSPRSC